MQSRNFGGGVIPRTLAEAPPVFGPRHQFPLVLTSFPLFLFYETTTALHYNDDDDVHESARGHWRQQLRPPGVVPLSR